MCVTCAVLHLPTFKTVWTPLSSCQKYYYDMLKRRVTSAAELLVPHPPKTCTIAL